MNSSEKGVQARLKKDIMLNVLGGLGAVAIGLVLAGVQQNRTDHPGSSLVESFTAGSSQLFDAGKTMVIEIFPNGESNPFDGGKSGGAGASGSF